MLKRTDLHTPHGTRPRLRLELGGLRGAAYEPLLGFHPRDEGEMLFQVLEQLDALIGGCDELLEMVSPEWPLPHLFGEPRLQRTLEGGEYGVAVLWERGVLAHATGSRKYEHNVARAALEAARARLDGWRGEVEVMSRRTQQAEMERAS